MDQVAFGKTGIRASVLGLGGGGYSRLGTARGKTPEESVAVVRRALDLGVTLFDTARGYGTEPIFGEALRGVPRDTYLLCTKAGGGNRSPEEFRQSIDESLVRLRTDYIDLYEFHAVRANGYPRVVEELLPVMEQARQAGKIRFIGLTEQFGGDPGHVALSLALKDDVWDAMMVGCNILNFCACDRILPHTTARGIATLGMFAVRHALVNQDNLRPHLRILREQGKIDISEQEIEAPLAFLLDECQTLPEAAYRFCRHHCGIDVVLSGTGSVEHLEANVRAVQQPPLSDAAVQRIRDLFGAIDTVSGNTTTGRR